MIQCRNEVEVPEDGGSVLLCASADLSGSEEWSITTIDDADAIGENLINKPYMYELRKNWN